MTILDVANLRIEVPVGDTTITPVDDVSFAVGRGEILGIAGESGAGKSLALKSLIGLAPHGSTVSGELRLDLDGTGLHPYDPAAVRGRGISFVFQEPMTALNPTMRVGNLIAEGLRVVGLRSRSEVRARVVELLTSVGVPDPARRARMWPHQLSGGLRQRVMIAVALSTNPKLLLCDEPTTALDVSVQDQILGLLHDLRERTGIAIVFVSHDLAVLGELCDRLVVMYAGRVMETGPVQGLLSRPNHPYTEALTRAVPTFDVVPGELYSIPGQPPDPQSFGEGCRFAPRCHQAAADCHSAPHRLAAAASDERRANACIHPLDVLIESA